MNILMKRNYVKYMYSDSHALANSVDPDQTAPQEQFDLGLHFLPLSTLLTHNKIVA